MQRISQTPLTKKQLIFRRELHLGTARLICQGLSITNVILSVILDVAYQGLIPVALSAEDEGMPNLFWIVVLTGSLTYRREKASAAPSIPVSAFL